jgi:hypothetical protein
MRSQAPAELNRIYRFSPETWALLAQQRVIERPRGERNFRQELSEIENIW